MPVWEEPGELGAPPVEGRAFVVAAPVADGFQSRLAMLLLEDGEVRVLDIDIDGEVSAAATDGHGNVIASVRPSHEGPTGRRLALTPALRGYRRSRGSRFETFTPDFDSGKNYIDPMCGADGAVGGWLSDGSGPTSSRFVWLHGRDRAPFDEALLSDVSFVSRCAFSAATECSSVWWRKHADGTVVTRICDGERTDEPVPDDDLRLHGQVALHSSGVLVNYGTEDWGEGGDRVMLRAPGSTPRWWDVEGQVFAATFSGPSTVVVHTAHRSPNEHGAHLRATLFNVEDGPIDSRDLDDKRGSFDAGAWPPRASRMSPDAAFRTPMLLPRNGNGRPLFVRIDDVLVLVSGRGRVWSWPMEGGAGERWLPGGTERRSTQGP